MRENRIRVLKVEPKKAPEIAYLDNSLRALQEAVSTEADYVGLIEIIEIDDEACILCNEEAKLINLEPNRRFGSDIICGTFYVTGQDGEGDLASLSDELMVQYQEQFAQIEELTEDDVAKTMVARFYVY